MADNVQASTVEGSTGPTFASDQNPSTLEHYPICKLAFGVLNTFTLVSASNPLPVTATVDTELPTAAALADDTANPTTTSVGAFPHWWDGSTWDRAPGTAADGLTVNLGANNDVTVTSGNIIVTNAGTFAVQAVCTNAGTFAVQVSSIAAGDNNIGNVDVLTVPTDPFGANADAASATGSISAKLRFIASTGIPITGTVTVGSHAVTNAGTFAVQAACTNAGTFVTQENGAALTALQLLDNAVVVLGTDTYTEATSSGYAIGAVRRDADTTLVNTTNEWGPLQMDANGRLKVEAFSGEALPVTDNGSTLSIDDGASSITVDYATTGSGTATGALRVELPTNGTGVIAGVTTVSTLTGGGIAHNAADSGNPVKVGLKVETSPKGITLADDADRSDWYADADGMAMVKLNTSNDDVISEAVSNTDGASTISSGFGAVANTHNCITSLHVFRTDAGTTPIYVDFRDGTAGAVLYRMVIPAGGGANNPPYCAPYLFRTTQNVALAYDVSAATTTVYINTTGYQSKA